MRSRAVSLPESCCFLIRSPPPPSSALPFKSSSRFMCAGGADELDEGTAAAGGAERGTDIAARYKPAPARLSPDRAMAGMSRPNCPGRGGGAEQRQPDQTLVRGSSDLLASGASAFYSRCWAMSHSVLPSPYPLPGEIIDDKWRVEKILGAVE